MTENDTLEVVLLYNSEVCQFTLLLKVLNFNVALNKDVSWSSFPVFDRTLFQSEGPLADILYFDL